MTCSALPCLIHPTQPSLQPTTLNTVCTSVRSYNGECECSRTLTLGSLRDTLPPNSATFLFINHSSTPRPLLLFRWRSPPLPFRPAALRCVGFRLTLCPLSSFSSSLLNSSFLLTVLFLQRAAPHRAPFVNSGMAWHDIKYCVRSGHVTAGLRITKYSECFALSGVPLGEKEEEEKEEEVGRPRRGASDIWGWGAKQSCAVPAIRGFVCAFTTLPWDLEARARARAGPLLYVLYCAFLSI